MANRSNWRACAPSDRYILMCAELRLNAPFIRKQSSVLQSHPANEPVREVDRLYCGARPQQRPDIGSGGVVLPALRKGASKCSGHLFWH